MENDVFNKMVADKISNHIELDKQGNTLNEIVYKCVYSALNIKDEVYYNDKVNDLKSALETFFVNSANNYMKYNGELKAKGDMLGADNMLFCAKVLETIKMTILELVKQVMYGNAKDTTNTDKGC